MTGEIIGWIRGPSFVLAAAEDDRPTRWCFQCRKHLPHAWELLDCAPEDHPTYYEPIPVIRCSRCNEDHTMHPGSYRDGPAWPSEAVCEALNEAARRTTASEGYKRRFNGAMERWRVENACV